MVQEATKKETLRIAAGSTIGFILMLVLFALLHGRLPETVPFDYRVVLGGVGGTAVAVLNFFLMGLTVQKVSQETDEKLAFDYMKTSYRQRMLLQILWIILALVLPCFNGIAGLIPLLFPGVVIKIYYIFFNKNNPDANTPKKTDFSHSADSEQKG